MNKSKSIVDAVQFVLKEIGRSSSISEIYATIIKLGLYEFNTPHPEHVIRTAIQRHTINFSRVDSSNLSLFEMINKDVYKLIEKTKPMEKKSASGIKRIHRAVDKEEIISALTSTNLGVFREIWKLLLFAAQIGIKNDKRQPLSNIDSGKGIDQSTFGNSPAWPGILYLIGLVETDNPDILSNSSEAEEQRIAIFQEYANGGLEILKEYFSEKVIDVDGILSFIDAQTSKKELKIDLDLMI